MQTYPFKIYHKASASNMYLCTRALWPNCSSPVI